MIKYLILLITVFLLVGSAQSQIVEINDNCRKAYINILSLQFDDAKQNIQDEKNLNPDNVTIDYLENYIEFLSVTISEDENLFNKVEENIQRRVNRIKKLDDSCRFKNYFLGNINLQWATANLRFQNYATGAFQINKAYRMLKENNIKHPHFFPNSITLGVLHIMIGIVPDSYNWLLNLVSMSGSVEQGRAELLSSYKKCLADSSFNFLQDEVLFYMGMVDLSLSPDPEYATYLLSKIDSNNNSILLSYLAINTMMKNGRNDDALLLFTEIDTTQKHFPFYYLDFIHGECYLRDLNTKMAKQKYLEFATNFTGSNYIKDAWQKIAWCYLFDGDTASYIKTLKKATTCGKTNIDADKNAEKAAENITIPSIVLLKARLLSDGGYNAKADSLLKYTKSLYGIQLIEKNYRLGRIAHQMKNFDEAKKHYLKTIKTGSSYTEYFAANSALKLGNIYEMENDTINSRYYYNLCLKMDFDEYRNSIRGKAKQGLERIEF